MRKNCLLIMLLAVASWVHAQRNPVEGYIITNSNDTVYGTIDYLTGLENAQACHFRTAGEVEFRTYMPTEIKGYRFADNGVFYVSRTFPLNGADKTFFAEYLLQGAMSLYRYVDRSHETFFLVDEEGKVAVLSDYNTEGLSAEEALLVKRQALKPALDLMSKSKTAMERLWRSKVEAPQLVSITRQYVRDFCTDAGDCVEFQYDSRKSSPSKFHLRVEADLMFSKSETYHGNRHQTSPRFGIGGDWVLNRLDPGLAIQATLMVSQWKALKNNPDSQVDGTVDFKWWNIEEHVGVIYSFLPKSTVSPYVRGGLSLLESFEEGPEDLVWGAYVGAGLDFLIGQQHCQLGLNASYARNMEELDYYRNGVRMSSFYVSLAVRF